ncbi:DUF2247 family protein [Gimesia chilikensis]|jgi:hypothetical protein|uniref:DUF2247 family protein n=1 Tax=Gimesia chilikensis TaxID=2605989 RepID=UPI0011888513|nr:DUF2247 family protein [Gimesia chilikensis]MCR9232378.1 DUF2247 family protein [bacterium]QDT85378.1 hypothetical protein MalM14_30460 [Gimesia chilikensis]
MLKVPSKFLTRLREPVDWSDLKYAYDNQLVDGQAVIDHACHILSESGRDNDDVLAIASARETDELKPLIDRVVGSLEHSNEHSLKWALILAAFISEADVPDKLEAIEDVYSSFDYPEELAQFVCYMPMNGPDLGSKEANENRMLESLRMLAAEIVASE